MTVYLTHGGRSITLVTDPVSFRVQRCSHWELIDDLVRAGVLARVNHGPATYGHCDYFYR